jgi:hypothetical protein
MCRHRSGTIAGVAAGGLGALALGAATVLAAGPVKDGVYRGSLAGSASKISISFRVSAAGGKLDALKMSALPIYCPGNGPPGSPALVFLKTKITHAKFSTSGKDMIASGPLKGSVAATLKVTGSFAAGGSVQGTVTTTFGGPAKSCGGHSTYSART